MISFLCDHYYEKNGVKCMPIFEFKCLECENFFEILVLNNDEKAKMNCPECEAENFERVLSTTNFTMGIKSSSGENSIGSKTRKCAAGSCTTYDIPGQSP
jgi:putative FmdB family regulatory protein